MWSKGGDSPRFGQEKRSKKTFEWQKHSLFLVPHNYAHQFSNMQGDKPVRLLHYNYMPLTLSGVRDVNFIFGNSYEGPDIQNEMDFYSEAKMVQQSTLDSSWNRRAYWYGNFFPDMRAWDKLDANVRRGAGGRSVYIQFPDSEMSCHMSVFDARLYKKAHRHGPGRVIVIPAGEGYSIMWEEGKEKVVVPWHEASCFVPPNKWFHQHFNAGGEPARYLALHPPMQFTVTRRKSKTAPRTRLNMLTKIPRCGQNSRASWQNEDSRHSCRRRRMAIRASSGIESPFCAASKASRVLLGMFAVEALGLFDSLHE